MHHHVFSFSFSFLWQIASFMPSVPLKEADEEQMDSEE